MRSVIVVFLFVLLAAAGRTAPGAGAEDATAPDPAQWRGFNLLEKFTAANKAPYHEDDFRWIAELGFNFVRLPMDYRCYSQKNDWLKFDETALREIDTAIDYGRRYGIHVCLNLHRAPGYCINPPEEPRNLWTDQEALDAFIAHWVMFARRYREIPSHRLSFNLLNEPAHASRDQFLRVFSRTIEAIRQEDPNRVIIVDGMEVGSQPVPEFVAYPHLVQATRGYHPATISHYRASWAQGSDKWPLPVWPMVRPYGMLYGPAKREFSGPLVLRGEFRADTEIGLKLSEISQRAKLIAQADGKTIDERTIDPVTTTEDWKRIASERRWVIHEVAREVWVSIRLPDDAREVSIANVAGDWLKFSELRITRPGATSQTFPTDVAWGQKPGVANFDSKGQLIPSPGVDPEAPLIDYLRPWREISAQGESVFVGEWGCYNQTPHPVALAWMKSWLDQWKSAGYGWALWNFRGSFGILDSGRTDVKYEDWRGHQLDREMLNLLQQYQKY